MGVGLSTAEIRRDALVGYCLVNAAAGTIASRSSTILNVVRTGVGVYEITLTGGGVAVEEVVFNCQALVASANALGTNVEVVTDTVIRVRTSSAGTAFDVDFFLDIGRRVTDRQNRYVASPTPPPVASVVGPGASTDNAIARWDGVTGTVLQNSGVLISDAGQVQAPLGSAAAPIFSFVASPDAGVFLGGASIPAIASAGTESVRWVGAQTRVPAGTAASPSFSFVGDIGTGIFNVGGANAVAIASATAEVTRFSLGQQLSQLGTAGAPSYSFSGDANTGAFSPIADAYAVTAGGAERTRWAGAQQQSPLGAAGSPSYSFIGDLDTGAFSPVADAYAVAAGGVEQTRWAGAQQQSPLGTAGAPSYSFIGDLNTGAFSPVADAYAVTAAGTEQVRWIGGQELHPAGTGALPAVSFAADPDTGVFSAAANQLGLAAGAAVRLTIGTTQLASTVVLLGPASTAANPTFSAATDTNTGLFFSAADTLDVTTGGTSRSRWDATSAFVHDFALRFTSTLTPAQLTANQNDYVPTSAAAFANAHTIRQGVDATGRTVTGLAGGASGRWVVLVNIETGATNVITLTNEDAASAAANRFLLPGAVSLVIGPQSSVILWYDPSSTRWRVVAVA